MGHRLHVCTCYKVEYSIKDGLNYCSYDVLRLLDLFNIEHSGDINDGGIEILSEDFNRFIEYLENPEEILSDDKLKYLDEIYDSIHMVCGQTKDSVIQDFKDFKDLAYEYDGYIRLCYF